MPRDLSNVVDNDGRIPGTPVWDREQRSRRILLDCLSVLKSSFQVEFVFLPGNVTVEYGAY